MNAGLFRITINGPKDSTSYYSWIRKYKNGKQCLITTLDESSNTIKYFNTKEEAEIVAKSISNLIDPEDYIRIEACNYLPRRFEF